MKVVSTEALTKLIQLVKGSFISNTDTEATSEITLATVATTGSYNDLTGKPTMDGQWVSSHAVLANGVSWTGAGATYSLASYLPNDSNDYEVIFGVYATTAATSGKFIAVAIETDIINSNYVSICQTRARSDASVDCRGSIVLPVGTGRTVTQYSTGSSNAEGTYTLEVYGYRRIGTNS
jgi:hypothetical protein